MVHTPVVFQCFAGRREELVIGERTVETHASAILSKLGLASRAELIAHMARSATARRTGADAGAD
jgi:hypothetical protein